MCRRARAAGQDITYGPGELPEDAPALDLGALYAAVEALERGPRRVGWISAGVRGALGLEEAG